MLIEKQHRNYTVMIMISCQWHRQPFKSQLSVTTADIHTCTCINIIVCRIPASLLPTIFIARKS